MKYVGFDIETAKVIPRDANLREERPLGITCAAFDTGGEDGVTLHADGAQMTPSEVRLVVDELEAFVEKGYRITTWNGLAFDFDILAEESEPDVALRVAKIAASHNHVDLMFHFMCAKGFRCGVAAACAGMLIEGKSDASSGATAPEMWAAGERAKVLEYVAQDARIQRLLTEAVEETGKLFWITKAGKTSNAVLGAPRSVLDSILLPEPDTSWMTDPPKRDWFHWWLRRYGIELKPDPKVF